MSRAELYANDLAEVHAVAIDGVFAILDDEESPNITNWLGTLSATGTTVQTAATTEQSARSGRNSANTTTLNNLKATLKTERSAAETAADRLYRNTEQNAWNTYTNATLTARISYIGSIKTSENTYKTAVDTAEATYRITTVTAYVGYQNTTRDLSALYSTAVTHAGDTSFNLASYFTTTGGNTACQAYEFITLQESNPHPATPYDPVQIQTPVFSDSIRACSHNFPQQFVNDGKMYKSKTHHIQFIITCKDTAIRPDAAEKTFCLIPAFIKRFIILPWLFAI